MSFETELLEICKKYTLPADLKDNPEYEQIRDLIPIKEAYIPYIPKNWNKILVLAESQNLTDTNYRNWLETESNPTKRMLRLGNYPSTRDSHSRIGVGQWDSGWLKIAITAGLCKEIDKIAVCNAVLWSIVTSKNTNQNPTKCLIELSKKIWNEYLKVIKPKTVVTVGNIAYKVISASISDDNIIHLRLPPQAILRVSNMFDTDDLVKRYPEVANIKHQYNDWFEKDNSNKNWVPHKIFFGCHAVSKCTEFIRKKQIDIYNWSRKQMDICNCSCISR